MSTYYEYDLIPGERVTLVGYWKDGEDSGADELADFLMTEYPDSVIRERAQEIVNLLNLQLLSDPSNHNNLSETLEIPT